MPTRTFLSQRTRLNFFLIGARGQKRRVDPFGVARFLDLEV